MTISMILVSALTCLAMDFLGGTFPIKPHPVPVVATEAR